jgi:hypothetical protein
VPLPDVLERLLTAPGPLGYESAPAFAQAGRAFSEDISIDVVGSAVVRVPGATPGAPSLAIVGHVDEIGLIVTHIDDEGFLRFTGVGGWDAQVLAGQRVELLTRDGPLHGVLGRKAPCSVATTLTPGRSRFTAAAPPRSKNSRRCTWITSKADPAASSSATLTCPSSRTHRRPRPARQPTCDPSRTIVTTSWPSALSALSSRTSRSMLPCSMSSRTG